MLENGSKSSTLRLGSDKHDMPDLERFKQTYGLRDCDVMLIPYGSRVYQTHMAQSDYDYIAIVPENRRADTGTEYNYDDLNVHIYNRYDFQEQLNRHKIHAMEAYFHPEFTDRTFKWKLVLPILRDSISGKSSHSFVKAKKKISVEHDFYIGWKSLFHSLRIVMFGTQIASKGKIFDYSAANKHWAEIIETKEIDWAVLKEKYQPIYNELATEFRKLAPKD